MDTSITAVCISRQPENWIVPEIPFYNYTEGWKPFGHEVNRDRIAYLAERRNKAVSNALSLFPDTEHILMIDSYYLQYRQEIAKLVEEYRRLTLSERPRGLILGASTWVLDKTRIFQRYRFHDSWTTPEAIPVKVEDAKRRGGLVSVKAVGACYLYPRHVWEKVGYGVPEDLHGCEHNWLCERSGMPVLLSMGVQLWHEPIVYPWPKRIRVSLHLGRLLGR